LEENLTELIQHVGHVAGGIIAFLLVRFTSVHRVVAALFGATLALAFWYISPVFFLRITPSTDADWFWAALIIHGIIALTLAFLGAFLSGRVRQT
jgi:Na+(H+)/acetate symporter ActP